MVTITNNVSAEIATGPITFTFSFNRDVGTTFTADDVSVTGGTKGAFTRLSGTGATLVVTPDADTTGTVQVSHGGQQRDGRHRHRQCRDVGQQGLQHGGAGGAHDAGVVPGNPRPR